jgi:hypothetical protein
VEDKEDIDVQGGYELEKVGGVDDEGEGVAEEGVCKLKVEVAEVGVCRLGPSRGTSKGHQSSIAIGSLSNQRGRVHSHPKRHFDAHHIGRRKKVLTGVTWRCRAAKPKP